MVLALLTVARGEYSKPSLCDKCQCEDGIPFTVDCMEANFREVPLNETDEYAFEWVLHLRKNPIKTIPTLPVDQPNLVKISFYETEVSTIADSAFAKLSALASLDLASTKLTKTSFTRDAFKGPASSTDHHTPLKQLQELDISNNDIQELPRYAFTHLTQLRRLVVSGNRLWLNRDTITAFTDLRALTVLDMAACNLTRVPDQFLTEMRHLEELNLDDNELRDVPDEISHATSLKHLSLNGNPILVISPTLHSRFRGPKSLRTLSLSFMPVLKKVTKEAFVGLDNLEVLRLSNNPRLTYIDKDAFVWAPEAISKLKEVYLQNNALTTLDQHMLDWGAVDVVDIQHNPWQCDCLNRWFAEGLVQGILAYHPKYAKSIMCGSPSGLIGVNLKSLILEEYKFPCLEDLPDPDVQAYGGGAVVTIIVGVALIVAATLVCSYVTYRRNLENSFNNDRVQYIRARLDNDLEVIKEDDQESTA